MAAKTTYLGTAHKGRFTVWRCFITALASGSVPPAAISRRTVAIDPAASLLALSFVFGILLAFLTPPLRGPDETAHFVRVYGLTAGDIVPATIDSRGRKGVWMDGHTARDLAFFEALRTGEKTHDFSYLKAFSEARHLDAGSAQASPRFVLYEGSEGYSPIAYLPQTIGATLARLAGLDFLGTLYAARLAGLAGATAIMVWATRLAGPLGWGFAAIALLPSVLYGRTVVSADAMTTATAMMIAALFVHAVRGRDHPAPAHGFWLLLCVLAKPPNIVFVLPDLLRRGWRTPTAWAVIIPAVAATFLWTGLSSADVAAWRLTDIYGLDAAQFEPSAKLAALMGDPWAFVRVLRETLRELDGAELWTQLIGVLGLFDTVLPRLAYPAITVLMLFALFGRLDTTAPLRHRAAFISTLTVLAYLMALAAIFYLVWTPIDAPRIWGLQGRYLVPALPFAAIAIAGSFDRAPPSWLSAAFALSSAVIGGLASIAAVLRTDWGF